jgi:hypothetical protein
MMAFDYPLHEQYADLFWSKVAKGDGCWEWQACVLRDGYGGFYPYRISDRTGFKFRAPRFAWELANKANIPAGLHVCHRCDNRRCVRPDHLFVGNRFDNMRDAARKGRLNSERRRGQNRPAAKLTNVAAAEIKRLLLVGESHADLSAEFGISRRVLSKIVKREAWHWLEPAAQETTLDALARSYEDREIPKCLWADRYMIQQAHHGVGGPRAGCWADTLARVETRRAGVR